MINLSNYALLNEHKKYGYLVTESTNTLNEAAPDMQTEDGVKKVLSGKTDAAYVKQWNQLVDDAATRKAAGTYNVTINHDDGTTPMVNLQYQIGTDLKPVKGSVKLQAAAAVGQNIDINKISTYDPKGKMNEFIAALMTVSIEKFGKSWTKAHIDWVNGQINKCKALAGFYGTISTYAGRPFLTGTGDVSAKISALTGGDKNSVNGVLGDASLRIAGSANSAAKLNVILVAMSGKLGESMISISDEDALIALYQLISPAFGSGQISTAWKALGLEGSPLANLIDEIDAPTSNSGKSLIVWAVGVRGLTATNADAIRLTGFDTASYTASLAQIKASLV